MIMGFLVSNIRVETRRHTGYISHRVVDIVVDISYKQQQKTKYINIYRIMYSFDVCIFFIIIGYMVDWWYEGEENIKY